MDYGNPVIRSNNQIKQEDTIDLVEVFYLMLEHFWQIALCVLVGGVIAFTFTYYRIAPQYTASAKIYIVSASNDSVVNLSDLQLGSQLTADYQDLMKSRPILEEVVDSLDLDMTYQQLANMISITNSKDTRILKVSVTGPSPQQAADIANELSRQAIIYLPKIMECDEPNMVEDAIVPMNKTSPSYSKNTMLGAIGAAALYCGYLLVRYLMNDTFITPDDVERCFGVRPLASIPEGDLGDFNHRKRSRRFFGLRKSEK